ncbi:MAG TPA: [acyl-carrier-protein] S-malonyltransferase [Helicobacteraceae bacterium]|nr:[acyl-carrier-protein] S-malonyltransferase [Helicobacteraceae bacterium]
MSKRIAMIFPGQGSQAIGMGKSFYDNSEEAREMFEKAGERIGVDFSKLLFEENDQINQTEFTQPAILLVSIIAYKLFQQRHALTPTLFLGHSLGELTALCAAGTLDYLDAVELVHKRGALMKAACEEIDAGMMALVGLDDASVETICTDARNKENKSVWPANYNQDGQLVIAGLKTDLSSLETTFKEAGAKRALLLNMSVSSHCPLLASAQAPLKAELERMMSDPFDAPVISNVTAKPYHTKQQAIELVTEQLIRPVLYKQSIKGIANDVDIAIEFGQGNVLKGLNRRINKEMPTYNVSDMESLAATLEAIEA